MGELKRIENQSEWIALGQIVATEGCVPDETLEHLLRSLKSFKRIAKQRGSESLYVFATEAIRAAANHDQVVARIKKELALQVDIITPSREAELSLLGTSLDCGFGPSRLLLELGGGSAQIARVDYDNVVESVSLPIGTGRIVAETNLRYPVIPGQSEAIEAILEAQLHHVELSRTPVFRSVICSGGVARGLWRALHPDGDNHLHRRELEYLEWATERLTVTKIGQRFGVKPKRAATLYPGAVIFGHLMDKFGAVSMLVSEFGVREGALLEIHRGRIKGGSIA